MKENTITNFKFFTAGRAKFIVSNGNGDKFIYKISKSKTPSPYHGYTYVYFISLAGNDFKYLGLLNQKDASVKFTQKSSLMNDAMEIKVLKWALSTIKEERDIPEGYGIQHSGECCRCGRELTDELSIERGIGPHCYEKEKWGIL